jgi:hypothetical protein
MKAQYSLICSAMVVTGFNLTATTRSHAAVQITDFSTTNAMTLAFGGSTWAGPNQFQFFTSGAVQGQEVVPISGGSPTVSGGAYRDGLSLDLTGQTTLELTACLLPLNQAVFVQVTLFDADGTHARLDFPTSSFNTSSFTVASTSFSTATITAAGSAPGLNLATITAYQIQGDYYDLGGAANARFQMQFDQLGATMTVPEPTVTLLITVGLVSAAFRRQRAIVDIEQFLNDRGRV